MSDVIEQSQRPPGDPGTGGIQSEDAAAFRAAAHFIRVGARANAGSGSHEDRQRAEQEQIIRSVQGGHSWLIPDGEFARLRTLSDDTSEHWVLVSADGSGVLKVTWPAFYGQIPAWKNGALRRVNACPSDYLDRQALQNEVFASDLRLEGANISDKPSMVLGEPFGSTLVRGFTIPGRGGRRPSPDSERSTDRGFHAAVRL